jgi:hypothetical protein
MRRLVQRWSGAVAVTSVFVGMGIAISCNTSSPTQPIPEQLSPARIAQGKDIFRFDTYGDEKY